MAVASPPVLAFAKSAAARHPLDHARGFLRESCDEADRIACATARMIASPHQQGIFTVELAPVESPHTSVDYDYAGKQHIPAGGLAPTRNAALWAAKLWAANGRHEERCLPNASTFRAKSDAWRIAKAVVRPSSPAIHSGSF
jgi:hypothetical protein